MLDGEHLARRAQQRRLDAHRAAAGADVPHDAARGQRHLRQRHRPHFGRRQQAVLGLRLDERFVGVAERAALARRRAARRARPASRTRIITLSGSNSCAGDLGERAAGDALVAGAQVLAHVGREVVDPPLEQRPGHGVGPALFGREQAHLLRRANAIDDRVERVDARFVRYASSQLSFTRANASCMLLTCGTISHWSWPMRSHRKRARP